MFGSESFRGVADAVCEQNGQRMLEIVQELEHNGRSLHHFCRELARYWRNLLVLKIAGKATRLIGASEREQQSMLETASQFSEEDLTRYLQLTLDLFKTLQSSLQPRFHLELGLVKLIQVGKLQPIEEAINELSGDAPRVDPVLRATAPAPRSGVSRLAPTATRPAAANVAEAPPPPAVPKQEAQTATLKSPPTDFKSGLHAALVEGGLKMSADAVQHSRVAVDGREVTFTTAKTFMLGLRDPAVAKAAAVLLGGPVKIRVEVDASMAAISTPSASGNEESRTGDEVSQRALADPGVKRFQELFPGAHIRTVRNLNE
jgi:DNA polymerase-3 subunit gamma/tau